MIVFGLHSSFFDIVTFLTLYYGFKADETIFQTGWFTESVMTELLILFIIRTRKSMFKSRPGKYLFWFSLLAVIFTLIVILTPLCNELGLAIPNKEILWAIAGILVLYVITADMIKIVFFKRNK